MAIPVARVHLAMAHAALPGLLPSPPKFPMLPLLLALPCAAVILPNNSSPPRPSSRAEATERWDAHKTKSGGGTPAPPSASSPGSASSCEKWVSNNKKSAATSSSSSRSGSSRADSEERWDANKKPASAASSSAASRNKGRSSSSKRRPNNRASSSAAAGRWDAQKNGRRRAPRAGELGDDGGSSTGSNDVEEEMAAALPRAFYAGPGFVASPAPSMLPMPSFMVRVAA
ncbi:unnamed protein product [Urochloa humidicola]